MNGRRPQAGCWLVGALAAVGLAGCAHYAPTPAARRASFQPYAATTIGTQTLADYARVRVGTLFWGADGLTLTETAAGPGGVQTGFHFRPQGPFGYGLATAVDPRGYFLTAAHCARRGPIAIVWLESTPGGWHSRLLAARVVARGAAAGIGTDLAVLRVEVPLARAFSWTETFANGDPVVAVGQDSGPRGKNDLGSHLLGGALLGSTAHPEADPARVTLFDTLLVHQGDSGGPLLTPQGRLLGINVAYAEATEFLPPFHRVHAIAHRPDLGWLGQVIDADWAAHPP